MQNYNSKLKIKHSMSLKLSDFDYNLPKNLIAARPHEPRDKCRLLVYNRQTKKIKHTRFDKILNFLKPDDILVLNDTKVIPARLIGKRITETKEKGRKFKVLLLSEIREGEWETLIDGKKRRVGLKIDFGQGLTGEVVKWLGEGKWKIKFNKSGKNFWELIFKLGKMPLPPYIKQTKDLSRKNKIWYQTIYAKRLGSVAAPTAGLHFTKNLLEKIKRKGVRVEYITLHVGLGTFAPVREEDIKRHKMQAERVVVSSEIAKRLNQAKKEGRRIVACGTTTVRALEAVCKNKMNIFIYPPYKFKFVDALITNFHLPKSTLLMMITSFVGSRQNLSPKESLKIVKKIYKEVIKRKYKFYSYGDAMLIL
jgi:S-adenosylmethionine:tRNA ribosyltransferase-isomerase